MTSIAEAHSSQTSAATRVLHFVVHEAREALPPTLFFAGGFNLIVFSMNLVLADYYIQFASFMLATMSALIVGKAVLVAHKMRFLRAFDTAPLIFPIMFKTVVFWAFVLVARLLEAILHYIAETGAIAGFGEHLLERFSWHRFAFIQIWILVLFLIYCTVAEFNTLFGDGELTRLLFRSSSTEVKLTRRQRIRALVQIDRLTKHHSESELRDPDTAAHRRFVGLLMALTTKTPE